MKCTRGIAYEVAGQGPRTILLIAPLAGSIALWGRFHDLLAEQARVISYDHRGLGESSAAPLGLTTRDLARDAVSVLDAAGVQRADVFGISLGGMVATWLAADAPTRVDRLILASTLVRGISLGRSPRALLEGVYLATCVARGDRAMGRCFGRVVLSSQFRARHPGEAERIACEISAAPRSRRAIAVLAAAAARHDGRAALAAITAPTLVLSGGADPLVTAATSRRAFAPLPDVTFDVLPAAGHALDLEAPDAAAAAVTAFQSRR